MGAQVSNRVPPEVLPEELRSLTRPGDRKLLWTSFCAALAIHIVVLLINFPAIERQASPPRRQSPIVVKRYVPPPPRVEERPRVAVKQKQTRKIPIPDPTPDVPEPITEPLPEIVSEAVPGDVYVLIGDPAPPATYNDKPLLAGVGGTTFPVRLEESYVEPDYPEIARVARIEGNVILQAVINREGVVDEIEVLRCNRPAFGFEEAAIAAVNQWRYEPARQNDQPVSVYFTIRVEFALL